MNGLLHFARVLELQLMYDTYYAETVDALKIIRFVRKPLTIKLYLQILNVVKTYAVEHTCKNV